MSSPTLADLEAALAGARYETARRLGLALLANAGEPRPEILLALHDALAKLADFPAARQLLEAHEEELQAHRFEVALRLAADFKALAAEGHYRISREARQGHTLDEYLEKYRAQAAASLARAEALAAGPAHADALRRMRGEADVVAERPARPPGQGTLRGRVLLPDGQPAADAVVTLGLEQWLEPLDYATLITHEMHRSREAGPLETLRARTDAGGRFTLENVPPGTHEFLAVTLDPLRWEIPTRFLARKLVAGADLGDLRAEEWESAPPAPSESPHPPRFEAEGAVWVKQAEWRLANPFHYEFPRQLLTLDLPDGAGDPRVRIEPGRDEPFQASGRQVQVLAGLGAKSTRTIAVYRSGGAFQPPEPRPAVRLLRESPQVWTLDTGVAAFRLPGPRAEAGAPPIQAVRGADGIWRGQGRFRLPPGVEAQGPMVELLEEGPLLITLRLTYRFSGGHSYRLTLSAVAGEPLLLARETSEDLEGAAFEFSLREFSGGRAYLHWNAEAGGRHWTTLAAEERTVALLPESVPWWIPPQGFGCALTPEGLDQGDYIGVFTRNRGEWIDRAFERIARGPIDEAGRPNSELDWPYPEMVGSSISMIRALTGADGDAWFQFGFFDGERQWALLASSLERNDGPWKEIGRLQHAWSGPRLQEFKDWHLDVRDSLPRPHVVARREELIGLRRKAASKRLGPLWQKIANQPVSGPRAGLCFAVEGDPAVAWWKRTQLLHEAEFRSRMTLLGRDWSDMYSPVGGRAITHHAEEYDLIAASGVFTAEEERQVRAYLVLMGHLYLTPDFMNWRFNARNANFEADRADIIGAIGLVFQGNPDAAGFLAHVIGRTRSALAAYCTPESGKWYENPACYYLHASKCRMNLLYHLARKNILDLDDIPYLGHFLRWGLLLLTPPQPVSYAAMRDGDPAGARVRKVPPIGDHAALGRWLPEHYFLIGKLWNDAELTASYFTANADALALLEGRPAHEEEGFTNKGAGSQFGNLPLLFSAMEEADLPARLPELDLPSRRLEGFGAVFRQGVGTPEEEYLLVKQGPGGYRYHRTEGSFLYFAKGHPLVYDGGEAGETWRHSTLSFHDVHMPLSAGRVERCFSTEGYHFLQGLHPEIIAPGAPVFLSDSCEHQLVEECHRRYRKAEQAPAAIRSFAWVGTEYLVIHDALDIPADLPAYWHLQVVGTPLEDLRFHGRFGVDLRVLLPGQEFDSVVCENLPVLEHSGRPEDWFAMTHLQLAKQGAKAFLAILRPGADDDLEATAIFSEGRIVGARVGADYHFFHRLGLEFAEGEVEFQGCYGAVLPRGDSTRLVLSGPGRLCWRGRELYSDGPTVTAVV
jgi:hypothetical protein